MDVGDVAAQRRSAFARIVSPCVFVNGSEPTLAWRRSSPSQLPFMMPVRVCAGDGSTSVGHGPDGHVNTQRIALPRIGPEVVLVVAFPLPAV